MVNCVCINCGDFFEKFDFEEDLPDLCPFCVFDSNDDILDNCPEGFEGDSEEEDL